MVQIKISQLLNQLQNDIYIAENTTLALKIGNVDITGFDGLSFLQASWRYLDS